MRSRPRSRLTCTVAFARALGCATLVLGLANACGGQSFKGGEATGGSPGDAGSGTVGGQAHAGRGSAGSSNVAGSGSTVGGGSALGGSGGASSDEACSGPSETGTCSAYLQRWTHDAATGLCRPIGYGGCGATKNNYETLVACQKACPGGSPNYDSCKAATDCVLAAPGCCGVCDGPSVTTHDFVAYNRQYAAKVQTCQDGVNCGACAEPTPDQGTRRYFMANCVRGECVVEDLRESAATSCETSDDCKLRIGPGCCQSCSGNDVIAVRNDGSFEALVCGDEPSLCPECGPSAPAEALAYCAQNGHCSVAYAVDLPL